MTWKIHRNSSETAGSASEEANGGESPGNGESATPAGDAAAQLQSELASAKAELDQCQDRFLRKAAELENYRKRVDREKAEVTLLAKSSLLQEFLPVADACERALGSLDNVHGNENADQYREGVRLLYKQISSVLSRVGVVAIESKGRKFDPHLHEAVTREESSEHEDNTVLLELRRGYLLGDRLLRPAQVIVSSRPPAKEAAGS